MFIFETINQYKVRNSRTRTRYISVFLLALSSSAPSWAEIYNSNTSLIRVRIGANGNTVNTVEYKPGIPAEMSGHVAGIAGVNAEAEHVSTSAASGSSGVYKIRIVADLNARNGVVPLTGTFSYDSSIPMACVTPVSCGSATISFQKIKWNARDSDTLNSVLQFDGTANQVFHQITDTNNATNGSNTRHRNYYQLIFENDELLPAGTYEGTTYLNGEGSY